MHMPESSCPVKPALVHKQWTHDDVDHIYHMPFNDLLHRAQQSHRDHFDPNLIQLSTLLNIKSGGCPEDCAYCPQSAHYSTGVQAETVLSTEAVKFAAQQARSVGATRFCMGAAWRQPKDRDIDRIAEMIKVVNELGMESCVTLGMLTSGQAQRLKDAGLDYYNHNIDSSREFYDSIITTRQYDDRLQTLKHVRAAGINVCCGGIVGMGESAKDRVEFLMTLANMPKHPESVPINSLVRAQGTPLEHVTDLDPLDMVRTIATTRIIMPTAWVRLSAGRNNMSDELQALCFYAGANSIFYGEKLLTTDNPQFNEDQMLFNRLGINAMTDQA